MAKEHFGHHFIRTESPGLPNWESATPVYHDLLRADTATKALMTLEPGHAQYLFDRMSGDDIIIVDFKAEMARERTPYILAGVVGAIHTLAEMKGRDWVISQLYPGGTSKEIAPTFLDELGYLADVSDAPGQYFWRQFAPPTFDFRISTKEIVHSLDQLKELEQFYAIYVYRRNLEGKQFTDALDIVRRSIYFNWLPRDDFFVEVQRLMEVGPTQASHADGARMHLAVGYGNGKIDMKKYFASLKSDMGDLYDHLCGHTILTRLITGNFKHLYQQRSSVHDDTFRDDFWDERTVTTTNDTAHPLAVHPQTHLYYLREQFEESPKATDFPDPDRAQHIHPSHTQADLQRVMRGYHAETAVTAAQLLGGGYLVIALYNLGLLPDGSTKTVKRLCADLQMTEHQYYHILGECIRYLSGWEYVGPPGPRRGAKDAADLGTLQTEAEAILAQNRAALFAHISNRV